MKVLYTAPLETSYSHNGTWFSHNQRTKVVEGVWLKPGERVVVLPPEPKSEDIQIGDQVIATENRIWGDMPMKVLNIWVAGNIVSVHHPVMGVGGFNLNEVTKVD